MTRAATILGLACAALLVQPLRAQETVITARPVGQARMLEVHVDGTSLIEVLTRACAAYAVELRIDPSIMSRAIEQKVNVDRTAMTLDELGLLLGHLLSLDIQMHDGRLTVAAAASDPQVALRDAASRQVEHAILAHSDPRLSAQEQFARADLLFRAGKLREAGEAYGTFDSQYSNDERAPLARLLGAYALFRAGRVEDGLSALERLERSETGLPSIPNAELLPCVMYEAAGKHDRAEVWLRRVVREGATPRVRSVAALLLAQADLDAGKPQEALEAIADFPLELRRAHPDLARRVPLATGLSLMQLGQYREALLQLRVAVRDAGSAVSRVRAALAIAECFVAADDPVTALVAIQGCLALAPEGAQRRRALLMRAELEERLGMYARAVDTSSELLSDKGAAGPAADRGLAILARCLAATDRLDDARRALEVLADRSGYRASALLLLAQLELRAGDLRHALDVIGRVRPADLEVPVPGRAAVLRFKGELLLKLGRPLEAAQAFQGAGAETNR